MVFGHDPDHDDNDDVHDHGNCDAEGCRVMTVMMMVVRTGKMMMIMMASYLSVITITTSIATL